ncbi:phage tail tape measure protein [Pasteurella multocida]
MLLNELLIKIGVKTNEKDLDKLKEAGSLLEKLPIAAGLIGAAFTGAIAGLTAFANAQLTALDGIHHLSRVTGEAVDKIYQLGKVAELNGSSSEAAQSSIKGLSKAIGEAAVGVGRGAKAFEDYGLSAKDAEGNVKDSLTVMGELSEKMQSMSEQEQIAMLSKLGIDESMIQTLRLGKQELAELMAKRDKMTLGVGTKENAQIAADFKDSLTDLSQMIKAVGEYLSLKFAPAIQRMIERFKNWFVVNNDLIKKGLSILGDSLAWVIDFFARTVGITDDLISNTIGWENAIYVLGAAFLWLSRRIIIAFATNPLGLLMMAITGVILLIDDFLTYLRGGESAFAEFWQPLIEWANLAYEKIMLFSQWVSENLPEAITGLALIVALFGNQLAAIGGMGVKVFAALMRFSGVTKVFSLLSGGLQILLGWGSKLLVLLPRIATAIRAAFISNPVGAVISIVAALAYSIYWLIKNWDDVKKSVGEFVDSASQWLETLSNNISTWFENKFNALSQFFEEFGKTIKAPFDTAFKWIKEQYDKYISPIVDTVRNFSPSSIVDSVADGAKGLWNSVTDLFNDENPSTVGSVTQQALTQSSADNRMTNSNNKITQHITLNGVTDMAKDVGKVAFSSVNAVLNTKTSVVM